MIVCSKLELCTTKIKCDTHNNINETIICCGAQQKKMLGGLKPVDPNSPNIVEIATWAVNEYNKKHGSNLNFDRVLKAEQQVVAGMMYYIDLEASNGSRLHKYSAKVFDQPWTNTRKLQEFKPLLQENEHIAVAN